MTPKGMWSTAISLHYGHFMLAVYLKDFQSRAHIYENQGFLMEESSCFYVTAELFCSSPLEKHIQTGG